MSPNDFAIWMKKFFNGRDTMSAIDIMVVKHTLANVEVVEIPKAKSGGMHFAPGVVYENPNLDK